ncbi:type IIL restriction-modification enzyme MmeI [Actinomycetota bacterium]
MVWQKMVGGRIKNDPRFASTVTWNTFPLPRLSASDRSEIVQAPVRQDGVRHHC